MANRTVAVRLHAEIGQYVAGLSKASAATMRLGDDADRSAKRSQDGFDLAGKAGLLMGGAVAAGIGLAISKSAQFESSMSAVASATQATSGTLDELRAAAMKAGAETQYSATEAANAITEMAKAGVSAEDVMGGGLSGALDLAAAGQLDVAKAAEIASVAMTQFSLSGEDLPHVADLLAAGAGKAMGSVEDLGMALNQAGLVASAAGLSIEETTGTLAAFASAGLVGADAGTSLKALLQMLQGPTKKSSELMAQLGIDMYDTNGQMLGAAEMAGELQTGLSGLTEEQRNAALTTIFGSDAVRAANVLYREGAHGIEEWTGKVNDAGYAQETAAALTDNLKGDLERLGGSFDTLMIQLGSGAQGPLREVVQMFTGLLDVASDILGFWSGLPGPVQAAVGAMGAFALLNGPLSGMLGGFRGQFGGVTGTVSAFTEALQYARANGDGLGTVLKSVGSTAGDAARGGLAAFARAIGPELGVAAAVYLVSDIAAGINTVATAGDDAADRIKTMRGEIETAEGTEERFGKVNTGLKDLKTRAEEAQRVFDGFNNQGWFDKYVWQNPFGDNSDIIEAKKALEEYRAEILRLEEGNARADQSIQVLGARFNLTKAQVIEFADAHGINLSGSLQTVQSDFIRTAESTGAFSNQMGVLPGAITTAGTALAFIGETAGMTEEQIKTATDAITKWREELMKIGGSFVEPLAAYKAQLDEKTEAEKAQAQATADATADSSDSWKTYVGDVSVSLSELAADLEQQIKDQENWRANIIAVTQRGGLEVGQALAAMGTEGAGLVAQMANATDAEFNRMRDAMVADARLGGQDAAAALDTEMRTMAAIGAAGAKGTAEGIAKELSLGVDVVKGIAAKYGVNLAAGINPLLTAVGKQAVNVNPGMTGVYAEGGYTGPGGKYTPAGIVHAGEYVFTKKQTENAGVANLAALASSLDGYAGGGFVSVGAVPKPYSTAPAGVPVSTAGDGTMQKGYDEVTKWLAANLEPTGASGGSASGLLPGMAAARQYVMDMYGVRNIGGFARRNIAGTNTLSDHALGKAIDVMTSNKTLGWAIANDLAFGEARRRFNIENVIWQQSISSRGGPFKKMADRGSITQNHYDHIHADTYDSGGWLQPGYTLAYNGTGAPERVLGPQSREFAGAVSGRSGGAVAPNVTVEARVFVGDREITDIVRVESTAVVNGRLEDMYRQKVRR